MAISKSHYLTILVIIFVVLVFSKLFLISFKSLTKVKVSTEVNFDLKPYSKVAKIGNETMQDDPKLIALVKSKYLYKHGNVNLISSPETESLIRPNISEEGLIRYLSSERISDKEKKGFFIEVGANDGRMYSTTYILDKDYNWDGLLIEPMTKPYKNLLKQNRQVWHAKAAISPKTYQTIEFFYENAETDFWGGFTNRVEKRTLKKKKIQTFPLMTFILALGLTHVDLLILDTEGGAEDILKTIQFESIYIDIIVVEVANERRGALPIKELLFSKDYILAEKTNIELSLELKAKVSVLISKKAFKSVYYIFKKMNCTG